MSSADIAARACLPCAGTAAGLRVAALLAGLAALIAWAYWPAVRELAGAGERSDTHFAFVAPAFVWLVWLRLDALKALALRPCRAGALLLVTLALAWALGELSFTRIVVDVAVVAMLPAALLAVAGPAWVCELAFPLSFLAFAVPFWAPLVPHLVDGTAGALAVLLPLSGIPMHREGAYFSIPSGNWAVADACSGVEYLGACVILGALMAQLFFTSWRRRMAFFAAAMAVGVVGNWLRAYLTVLIAHLSDNRYLREDHGWFGWLLYALMLAALGWLGWRSRDPAPGIAPLAPASTTMAHPAWAAMALATLALWPAAFHGLVHPRPQPAQLAAITPQAGWQAVPADPDGWKPLLHHPIRQDVQSFRKDGHRVDVHIGLFANQSWDSKLVDARHKLADPELAPWAASDEGRETIELGREKLEVDSARLLGPEGAILVWQWYQVGAQATSSSLRAKLRQLQSVLSGGGDAGLWVAVSGDDAAALRRFVIDMAAALPSFSG